MKAYVIDQLDDEGYRRLTGHLDEHCGRSTVEGVYWLPLEPRLLTPEQRAHRDCQPFYMALELDDRRLKGELLVRTHSRMHCTCMAMATRDQRDWLIDTLDDFCRACGIR